MVDAEVSTTFSLRLPVLDDDALRYGMVLSGKTSFRASLVLGPPDAAQNWIRLSKSDTPTIGGTMLDDDVCVDAKLSDAGTSDVANDSRGLFVVLYEDSDGNGNPAPMIAGVVLATAMDRSLVSRAFRSANVKSKLLPMPLVDEESPAIANGAKKRKARK